MTYVFPKLGAFPLPKAYPSNSNMSFIKVVYLNKNFTKLPKTFRMIIQKGYSTEKMPAIIGGGAAARLSPQNAAWLFVIFMIKQTGIIRIRMRLFAAHMCAPYFAGPHFVLKKGIRGL